MAVSGWGTRAARAKLPTITAQVIAFDISAWALVLVALGFLFASVVKRETQKAQGTAVMGLGLVFFGMTVMSEAVEPLRDYEPFIAADLSLDTGALPVEVSVARIRASLEAVDHG